MITIDLSASGDRIVLVGGYTPGLAKTVPGARFVGKEAETPAHWLIPLSLAACHALRAKYGSQLRVGLGLSDWYRAEKAAETRIMTLGASADADLTRVPEVSPVLAKAMASRTYQRVGARFIAEGRSVLIADQPGLGKTLEAIGGVIESGVAGPYLVVAPKTATHVVWAREIPRWLPGTEQRNTIVTVVPDGKARRDAILDEFLIDDQAVKYQPDTWVVVHPEMLRVKRWWVCPKCEKRTAWKAGRKSLDCITNFEHSQDFEPKYIRREDEVTFPQLFAVEWGAVICDESDRMLIRRNASQTQVRNGAEALRVRPDGLRIAMSGTPMRGKPQLLWGTLNWLRPAEYSSYWRWAELHYETYSTYGGGREIGALKDEAALYHELNRVMLRRTKAEVARDMPAKTYVGAPPASLGEEGVKALELAEADRELVGVWLPMHPKQQKLYDQMNKAGTAATEGGTMNAIGILAEMTRLKQFATSAGSLVTIERNGEEGQEFQPGLPSNKFDYLLELLEEWGFPEDPTEKVVVVSQFTQVLEMFDRELRKSLKGVRTAMLTGAVTGQRRQDAIDAFNQEVGTDSPHILFLNVKAGGVAITLDTADHMVILDETWVPDDMEQVEDRIHRVSRPRPVFYHYLRSLGTIEEHIATLNAELRLTNFEVLDGRRGIEYARKIQEKL